MTKCQIRVDSAPVTSRGNRFRGTQPMGQWPTIATQIIFIKCGPGPTAVVSLIVGRLNISMQNFVLQQIDAEEIFGPARLKHAPSWPSAACSHARLQYYSNKLKLHITKFSHAQKILKFCNNQSLNRLARKLKFGVGSRIIIVFIYLNKQVSIYYKFWVDDS